MSHPFPPVPLRPAASPSRRSFLRYSGASAVVGSLWLASCKKTPEPTPVPLTPSIVSFTPGSGMAGATVTITGNNLGGTTAVLLGTLPVVFTQVGATVTFVVPVGAASGIISVTTAAGTAVSSTPFTVTAPPSTAPTITSFSPASAYAGTVITLTGTNLSNVSLVRVNGQGATPTVLSSTSLTFIIPVDTQQFGLATVVVQERTSSSTGTNNTGLNILPSTVSVGSGEAGALTFAYALEQLEAAFYTRVRTGPYYLGLPTNHPERLVLDDLYYHEVIHREFLKASLTNAGVAPFQDLAVDFSTIDFSSRTMVLSVARTLEDLGSGAYIGAAQFLSTPAYLFIAAKIASVEARHAAVIRDLVSEGTFVGSDILSASSLENAQTPSSVAEAVNVYLAFGSKLDTSNLR